MPSDKLGDAVECILCGHEGHEEDGVICPVDGDWYCDVCESEGPGSELPLVTDGGREQHTDGLTRKRPDGQNVGRAWDRGASENMAEWGVQHPLEVLSAINEEVGEIEQAYLEATHEGEPERFVEKEIDDLGPLLMQLVESVRNHPMAFEPLPTAEELIDDVE